MGSCCDIARTPRDPSPPPHLCQAVAVRKARAGAPSMSEKGDHAVLEYSRSRTSQDGVLRMFSFKAKS